MVKKTGKIFYQKPKITSKKIKLNLFNQDTAGLEFLDEIYLTRVCYSDPPSCCVSACDSCSSTGGEACLP